jgi:hypothetical protein
MFWSENIRMPASNGDSNMFFLQKACPKIRERGKSDGIISMNTLKSTINDALGAQKAF